MTTYNLMGKAVALIALVIFACSAVNAQEATPTVEPAPEESPSVIPPPNFSDGRINDATGLGGLAIYCVDQTGDTHVDTFEEGSITVWGVGDQKYIELADYQLRGNIEVHQQPSVMEAQMNLTATPEPTKRPTRAPTEAAATEMAFGEKPFLLARATTPTGEIGFFRVGNDEFALQGHDDKGKFFTYSWTECSEGVLDNTTAPYLPMLEATATVEVPELATAEVTASS